MGDCILTINGQNVSRASAKSVKKILRSISADLVLVLQRPNTVKLSAPPHSKSSPNKISKLFKKACALYKSHVSCHKPQMRPTSMLPETTHEISVDDLGYHSMPASSKHSSSTSLATTESGFNSEDGSISNASSFRAVLEQFIGDLQNGIEAYVRPTIALGILTERENFMLYQNVEKLVPVAKFLLNVIGQLENDAHVSSDSIKIVFSAFRTYLGGLPAAVDFLGEVTNSNDGFVLFLEKLDERALPLFDFVFMPFNFVCQLIEFFEEIACGEEKLMDAVNMLFGATMEAQSVMEKKFC